MFLGLALGMAVPAGAQATSQKPAPGSPQPPAQGAPGAAPAAGPAASARAPSVEVPKGQAPAYTIGPGDVLQIIVWKEPELTRDVTVRLDGMITVPLFGDLPAAGRTTAQVTDTLQQGLARYVQAPRVTVGIGQSNSVRFYIIGQVVKSGEFLLTGRTTVLQGLALAGGFKDFAKTDSIVIVRQNQTVVPVNYKRIADGKDVSQNFVLSPGDTIVVP